MGALSYGRRSVVGGAGGVARHPVLEQKAQEENQRHHDVAHSVEDDWPLRVAEPEAGTKHQNEVEMGTERYSSALLCWMHQALVTPGHVDEERQEGEERRRQADDGDDAHKVADEGQLLLAEEHGGARGGAVLLAHERVAQVRVHLELSGTPEAVVSLDGHG